MLYLYNIHGFTQFVQEQTSIMQPTTGWSKDLDESTWNTCIRKIIHSF